MLSTKVVGNVAQASHYFLGHDNYYTPENTQAKELSGWAGKGAEELGLSGPIDSATFTELLKGKLPDGQQLGLKIDGDIKHRPGFDLTFSVPKSVSILALLGEDKRILPAVQAAAERTLKIIERECAQARITKDGVTTYENTKNLVIATFLHDISREADPQLHVHSVIMNMTQRSDGKWRSLASQAGNYGENVTSEINGFIEQVRHHKKHYGAIFRGELAYEMKQLNYEIVNSGKNAFFEIAGITHEVINTFSTRSKQIAGYMKDFGFSGAKAAAVATLNTRIAKKSINRDSLNELWRQREDQDHIAAFAQAKDVVYEAMHGAKIPFSAPSDRAVAQDAISYAIAHLSETAVALNENTLLNLALEHAIHKTVSISALKNTINELQLKGDLILLASKNQERFFTTQKLIQHEQEIIKTIAQKNKTGTPLLATEKINYFLAQQTELTSEQKNALQTLLTSDNKINVLEGPTGSGKTYLIKPLMQWVKEAGYQPILLTPSKVASMDLQHQLKSEPKSLKEWFIQLFKQDHYDTVSGFIKREEKRTNINPNYSSGKRVIIVDNATSLSAKQLHDLLKIDANGESVTILLGDKKDILPWQSGAPFNQLLAHGVHQASLHKNLRDQDSQIKEALSDSLQNNIAAAFAKIGHRVLTIEDKQQRLDAMAAHVASLPQDGKTRVLMPTRAHCEEMNSAIREALKQQNHIAQQGIQTTVLLPKHFSHAQYTFAKNYSVDQWVRFNETYKSLAIERGEYLKITAIYSSRNTIELKNAKGDRVLWNPQKVGGKSGSIELFEEKQRELVKGDVLILRRSQPKNQLYSGETLTVVAVANQKVELLRDSNGKNTKTVTLDLSDIAARHFDYGYAVTPQQQSYKTTDRIIAYQNSYSRQSHQRLFYEELSQARDKVWIYTEKSEALLANLQKHSGDKYTALGVLLNNATYLTLLEKAVSDAISASKTEIIQSQLNQSPEEVAKDSIQYALAHLTEREAAFEHKDVLEVALCYALGDVKREQIQNAVKLAETNGDLIRGIYSKNGTRWTTPEAIQLEQTILHLAKEDEGKLPPIASETALQQYLQVTAPKTEHGAAIETLCQNTNRHLLIQGYAGTGKTTMLMHVAPLLKQQGYDLLCLAPTHVAVKELKSRGMRAQTLESFLMEGQGKTPVNYDNKLIVGLDEVSMVSNRRMERFMQFAQTAQFRTVLMGDRQQYPAIESGKPSTLLENHIKTVYLKEIERQKDPTLLQAVKESYQGDFAKAFIALEKSITEIGKIQVDGQTLDDRHLRLATIAQNYLTRSPEKRAQTLMLTLGNEDRASLNALVRQGLEKEKTLHGDKIITTILVPKDMTAVEGTRALNYAVGDLLRFGSANQKLGIEKNDYLTVTKILPRENYLLLEKSDGRSISWQPPTLKQGQKIEAYRKEEREIQAGDLIRWTRTDNARSLFSPELVRVAAVANEQLTLQPLAMTKQGITAQGEPLTIESTKHHYQHWDYAYAMTGYSSQSKTVNSVLVNLESFRTNLSSQAAFIVALTRAEYEAQIFTDDKASLAKQIFAHTGEKQSALETVGQWQNSHPKIMPSVMPFNTNTNNYGALSQQLTLAETTASKPQTKSSTVDQSKSLKSQQPAPRLDSKYINQLLNDSAETVVEKLLGQPKEHNGTEYRFGSNKGSLVVKMSGKERGLWYDFQTNEGGNLLKLIAKTRGLDLKNKQDYKSVLMQAVELLGTSASLVSTCQTAPIKPPALVIDKALSAKQMASIRYARKIVRESLSIKGTLAETYLQKHRGIHLEKIPSSFRFHPGVHSTINQATHPALVVVAKDKEGKVQTIQAIFLDKETAAKADVRVQKQTWGQSTAGATVDLISKENNKQGPIYLAEGPETGLSIYAALPNAQVKVTLGKSNFKNIDPTTTSKDIVFCLDNDGNGKDKDLLIQTAAERLIEKGKTVWVIKPEGVKDYNDLLKTQGVEAIKSNIENAMLYSNYKTQTRSAIMLKDHLLLHHSLSDASVMSVEKIVLADKQSSFNNELQDIGKQLSQTRKIEVAALQKVSGAIAQRDTIDLNNLNKTICDQKRFFEQPSSAHSHSPAPHTKIAKVRDKDIEL